MTVTMALALWGAVLSTLSILWNIRRDIRDRGGLRVHCYVGTITYGLGAPDPQPKLVYTVTNIGRRAVVLSGIGGDLVGQDKHFAIKPRGTWPKTLQPGEYHVDWTDDLSILSESVTSLWAADSLGKHWRIPKRTLRAIYDQHRLESLPANPALNSTGLRPVG